MDKRSENGMLGGGLWLEGHGLSMGSEEMGRLP